MSTEGLYGLDKELAEKAAAKYDPAREQQAREYIEIVSGMKFPSDSFHESLKDGSILCNMMNIILPSDPIKVAVSKMPFKQMENIGNFLKRAEKLGVPAFDRFQTVDLFEAKNLDQVINCIFSVSRFAAKAGFNGPILGPKLSTKNERSFSEEQLAASKNIVPKFAGFASKVGATPATGGRREIGGTYKDKTSNSNSSIDIESSSLNKGIGRLSVSLTSEPVSVVTSEHVLRPSETVKSRGSFSTTSITATSPDDPTFAAAPVLITQPSSASVTFPTDPSPRPSKSAYEYYDNTPIISTTPAQAISTHEYYDNNEDDEEEVVVIDDESEDEKGAIIGAYGS